MNKIVVAIGMSGAGRAGWWPGWPAGFMACLSVSVVGNEVGLVVARRPIGAYLAWG